MIDQHSSTIQKLRLSHSPNRSYIVKSYKLRLYPSIVIVSSNREILNSQIKETRGSQERKEQVENAQREETLIIQCQIQVKGKYSCCIKRKVDLVVPSLLIKLSQVLSPWRQAKFGPQQVKFSCAFLLLLCRSIASLFYNSFLLQVLIILSRFANADPGSNNWYHSISISLTIGIRAKG